MRSDEVNVPTTPSRLTVAASVELPVPVLRAADVPEKQRTREHVGAMKRCQAWGPTGRRRASIMIMCGACGGWERKEEERKAESRSDGQAVVVGQSSVHSLEFKLGLIQRNAE